MATKILIANEVLAYLQNYQEIFDKGYLTRISITHFTEDELRYAKLLLRQTLGLSNLKPQWSDENPEKYLEDIITLLKESKQEHVPIFVAKDLRKLPNGHSETTQLLNEIARLKNHLELLTTQQRSEVIYVPNGIEHKSHIPNGKTSHINEALPKREPRTDTRTAVADFPAARTQQNIPPTPVSNTINTVAPKAIPAVNSQYSTPQVISKVVSPPPKTVSPTQPRSVTSPTMQYATPPATHQSATFSTTASTRSSISIGSATPGKARRPSKRATFLQVTWLHRSTKSDDIVEYIRSQTRKTVKIEKVKTGQGSFKPYVIKVPNQLVATLLDQKFWPVDAVCKIFTGQLSEEALDRMASPERPRKQEFKKEDEKKEGEKKEQEKKGEVKKEGEKKGEAKKDGEKKGEVKKEGEKKSDVKNEDDKRDELKKDMKKEEAKKKNAPRDVRQRRHRK